MFKNKLIRIGLILFVIVLAFSLVRDLLIKQAVIAGAKVAVGVDVQIDGFSLGLMSQSVRLTGVRVAQPEGFPKEAWMIQVPEVAIKLDVPAMLFKNTLHVPYMRVDLKEAYVIRSQEKKMNVDVFKSAEKKESALSQPSAGKEQTSSSTSGKEMKMMLDLVSLNIGRVVYADYSHGGEKPRLTVMDINIRNREFKDIHSPAELGAALMLEAMTPASLDGLLDFGGKTVKGTTQAVGNILGTLQKSLRIK